MCEELDDDSDSLSGKGGAQASSEPVYHLYLLCVKLNCMEEPPQIPAMRVTYPYEFYPILLTCMC